MSLYLPYKKVALIVAAGVATLVVYKIYIDSRKKKSDTEKMENEDPQLLPARRTQPSVAVLPYLGETPAEKGDPKQMAPRAIASAGTVFEPVEATSPAAASTPVPSTSAASVPTQAVPAKDGDAQ